MREFVCLAFLALTCVSADAACTMRTRDNKIITVAVGDAVCVSTGAIEGRLMRCVAQGGGVAFEFVRTCSLSARPTLPSSTEKPLRDGDLHPFWNCLSSSRTGGNTYD